MAYSLRNKLTQEMCVEIMRKLRDILTCPVCFISLINLVVSFSISRICFTFISESDSAPFVINFKKKNSVKKYASYSSVFSLLKLLKTNRNKRCLMAPPLLTHIPALQNLSWNAMLRVLASKIVNIVIGGIKILDKATLT